MKMLGFDATRGWYELPHATEAYVQRNSRWPHPAVAVCLDKDLANGAWLSGNPRALIEEIATFLERRGVSTTFVRERPSFHFTAQQLAGRWRGFRSISRRSAHRASGMAEDGSVLTE